MSLKPLRDFLLVSRNDAPKQTAGGLYVPETVDEKIVTGTVVAVGSGRLTTDGTVVPLEVSVGDRVIFNKSYAVEIKEDNNTFLLLREEQIFCVSR
jgi:chaperonin GroES